MAMTNEIVQYCFSFKLLLRASFKLFVVKTNLGYKLGIDFSKNSNEFFHLLWLFLYFFWIYSNRFYKDTWKIHVLSKRLLTLRKILKKIENIVTNFIQNTSKEVFQSLFYENSTNSHIRQAGKLFLTQKFSNRTICFAVLVFTQICNNFHFNELFSRISLNTFIKKNKRLNVGY